MKLTKKDFFDGQEMTERDEKLERKQPKTPRMSKTKLL